MMSALIATAALAGGDGIQAEAERVSARSLRVEVQAVVTVPERTHARLWTDGCATPSPTFISCGPCSRGRTLRLKEGRNVIAAKVRATLYGYAPVPDGAGLEPYEQELVAESTDVAFVGLRVAGRERFRVLEVRPQREAMTDG